jgi:hypothetical protein
MSSVRASEIFDFLQHEVQREIVRTEIRSGAFWTARRAVRQLSAALRDSEGIDAEISERLAHLACSWLTIPVSFSTAPVELRAVLPSSPMAHAHWGRDLIELHDEAIESAEQLALLENPLVEALRTCWRDARGAGLQVRIYCHRKARPAFDDALRAEAALTDGDFIHSLSAYRQAGIFDMLLKVGPLRSFGWGSAPDAIITAPRFRTLRIFTWEGCDDEPGFGYDPAGAMLEGASDPDSDAASPRREIGGWKTTISVVGTREPTQDSTPADDLSEYHHKTTIEAGRAAILVQSDDGLGVLYPRGAGALSYDPGCSGNESIAVRLVDEDLVDGMFVIEPCVSEVDLGAIHADHGKYSRIWKEKLAKENAELGGLTLYFKLSDAGIDLENLAAAIDHWCKPPTTVIHAPKRKEHFKALIAALGLQGEVADKDQSPARPFWRVAWDEVKKSRGHAIQAGVEENEIVAGELREILSKQLSQLAKKAATGTSFETPIPAETGISGHFKLHRVREASEGFRAPPSAMRKFMDVESFEPWRE